MHGDPHKTTNPMKEYYTEGDNLLNEDPEVEEEPLTPPLPNELAEYFIRIYNDPEVSSFERTQSALALQMFWVGAELNRFNEQLEEAAENAGQ